MVRLIVVIEIPKVAREDVEKYWGTIGMPDHVSVDEAYLERDPEDDSFYTFELRAIE